MDRRKTGIIALAASGALAATAAIALNVPASGAMVASDEAIVGMEIEPTALHGTSYLLSQQYIAFTLDETGALTATGDFADLDQTIVDGITAQLQAAPAASAVIVDTESLDQEGLTTVLTTVTPTQGMTIATTNEEMQQWLAGVFPQAQGTMTSLDVQNIPNAAFTFTQPETEELAWAVTEYVFQYGDATVSARLSTTDTTDVTRTQIDHMLAGMTRG